MSGWRTIHTILPRFWKSPHKDFLPSVFYGCQGLVWLLLAVMGELCRPLLGWKAHMPFPTPGDLPHPGIEPMSLAMDSGFLTTESPGKSLNHSWPCINYTIIVTYLTFCPILPLRAESYISRMYRYMSKDPTKCFKVSCHSITTITLLL